MWTSSVITLAFLLLFGGSAFADSCVFFQDSRIPAQIGYGRVGDEDCQWPYLRPRIEVWCMSSSTVELISRPQSGQVTVLGPGFSYKAKADYQGPDAFTLRVSGTLMRKQGTSEIQVHRGC